MLTSRTQAESSKPPILKHDDIWKDGWMNGRTEECMDRWLDGEINQQTKDTYMGADQNPVLSRAPPPRSVTNLCRGPSVTNPCRGPLCRVLLS